MRKKILLESIQFGFAVATFTMARWMLGLSTPEKDYKIISKWKLWYYLANPIELYHQFKGYLILKRSYDA